MSELCVPRWSVRTHASINCDECRAPITQSRVEVRGDDRGRRDAYRFVCPSHELPADITHPLRKETANV